MIIRPMTSEDTTAVSEMEKCIFSQPWSRQGFEDSLCLEHTIFLVAEEAGTVMGYLGMYLALDEAEITNVAVGIENRKQGIGRLLVEKAKQDAKQQGVLRIVLEVRVSNQGAIHLYEQSGFRICGTRRDFYELPKEDAYIMIYGQ